MIQESPLGIITVDSIPYRVFPTETVYGIGANALSNRACEKIFKIKGRPADNPLIVHTSSTGEIEKIADVRIPEHFLLRLQKILIRGRI